MRYVNLHLTLTLTLHYVHMLIALLAHTYCQFSPTVLKVILMYKQ